MSLLTAGPRPEPRTEKARPRGRLAKPLHYLRCEAAWDGPDGKRRRCGVMTTKWLCRRHRRERRSLERGSRHAA